MGKASGYSDDVTGDTDDTDEADDTDVPYTHSLQGELRFERAPAYTRRVLRSTVRRRRDILRTGAAALALSTGLPLLAACGRAPSALGLTPAASSGALQLPSYLAIQGPQPDLPGTPDGIDAGYINYPAQRFQAVKAPPLDGDVVTLMTFNTTAPMTPLESNPAWQEINRQVGGTINLRIVPFADYQTVLASVIAGDDLPDVMNIPSGNVLGNFADFLQAKCADLTPFLSGDNVKEFPNLANFRTIGWKTTLFNNRIYAIPSQYPLFYWAMWVHKELFDAVTPDFPKTPDEFKRVLQQVTRPQDGVYGIVTEAAGGFTTWNGMFPSMFGAPNQWRLESGGKLTRTFETDEYKSAVAFARDLFSAGVFTPTSNTNNNVQGKAEFAARKAAVRWDGFLIGARQYWDAALKLTPPSVIRNIPPMAPSSSAKPVYWLYSGVSNMVVLKKATPERVKKVLGVINYLASPFGSQEFTLITYGVQDVDHTLDPKGNPILTTQGQSDVNNLWAQGWAPPAVLYYPKSEQFAPTTQADEKPMLAAGITDPTVGLYSPTNGTKGGPLSQSFQDGLTDIVAGRRPFGDFDQLVRDWRSAGGDQIRAEYEQALQQAST